MLRKKIKLHFLKKSVKAFEPKIIHIVESAYLIKNFFNFTKLFGKIVIF